MKISSFLIIFLLTLPLSAQVRNLSQRHYFTQGDVEVFTSLALGMYSTSYDDNYPVYYDMDFSMNSLFLELSIAPGFFLLDGLSIEPELSTFISNELALSLIANLSYTFYIPQKDIYPYVKIGFGKSSYGTGKAITSFDSDVLSAAAGLKIIQSTTFSMRLEVNYKKLTAFQNRVYYSTYYPQQFERKITLSSLSIKFGGSFLL